MRTRGLGLASTLTGLQVFGIPAPKLEAAQAAGTRVDFLWGSCCGGGKNRPWLGPTPCIWSIFHSS